MKMLRLVLPLMILFVACSTHVIQPTNSSDWLVRLDEVQIGAKDFHKSLMGTPLDISIELYEDGQLMTASTSTTLPGVRGQRRLRNPMRWLLHFDPASNYQLVVREEALIAETSRWEIPQTPKIGKWPFAAEHGRIGFGKESYLQFSLKQVKD